MGNEISGPFQVSTLYSENIRNNFSDLGNHFMNQHINTNGKAEYSEEFMLSFDVSPLIAYEKDGHEHDETLVLRSLDPLTKTKKKLLQHPLINTFVLLKYNSYTIFFIIILLLKIFHSIILTCLTIRELELKEEGDNSTDSTNSTDSANIAEKMKSDCPFQVYFWLTLLITALMFLNEIGELLLKKAQWFDLTNIVQMCEMLLIFLYILLVYEAFDLGNDFKYLPILIVFISWMDLTFSFQSLLFGKWSSLGLYISMLTEVSHLWLN